MPMVSIREVNIEKENERKIHRLRVIYGDKGRNEKYRGERENREREKEKDIERIRLSKRG